MAHLLHDLPREDLLQVTMFCAYFAAATCSEPAQRDPGAGLQRLAAQLARGPAAST